MARPRGTVLSGRSDQGKDALKVLLTGAQGDIGEAICRIINETYIDAEVHGSDIKDGTWPLRVGFSAVHLVAAADDPHYVAALKGLHRQHVYDLVIPTTDAELWQLARDEDLVSDIPILSNHSEIVLTFLDKLETVRWLDAHDLPAPVTVPLMDVDSSFLPLVAKPRRGHGGQGVETVRSPEELKVAKARGEDRMIAQELLEPEDAEFTCAVFRHAQSGVCRTVSLRRRLVGGVTGQAVVEEHEEITSLLLQVAELSRLDGSLNVQLRLTRDGPRIFEINPRFSSTVMMRHMIGFCDLQWAIDARLGESRFPEFEPPVGTHIHRLARELVVPPPA